MHWPKLSERKKEKKTILEKKIKQQSWLVSRFFKESLRLGNFYSKRFRTLFLNEGNILC